MEADNDEGRYWKMKILVYHKTYFSSFNSFLIINSTSGSNKKENIVHFRVSGSSTYVCKVYVLSND